MHRKLITVCAALAAFVALALSVTSAFAVELTEPTGTKLANGVKLLTTNVNGNMIMADLNGNPLVECSTAQMTGELVSNGSSVITGNITVSKFTGTGTSSDCTSSVGSVLVTTAIVGGLPYCLKTIEEKDEVELRGGKCSEASRAIKLTFDFTNPEGKCGYEVSSLRGTLTTDTPVGSTQDAVVHLDHAGPFHRFESTGFISLACPEQSTLDMSFTLETDEATAKPVYIS